MSATPTWAAAAGEATALKPGARATAAKVTSRIARTDRTLLGQRATSAVSVLVKLDYDPVATYAGDVRGYAATSPSVTGRALAGGSAEIAYERYVAAREAAFGRALASRLPGAKLGRSLRTVYGGIAVTLPANRVDDLLRISGVAAVQRDEIRQPLTDSSGAFIGADIVQQQLGGERDAGRGVIFGVLDTGAWPEHPSFADQGNLSAPPAKADGTARTCDFGVNPQTKQRFTCTNKLIGGAAFLDTYRQQHGADSETFWSARDSEGHGTHTASTSAGNALTSAKVFGVERGPLRGVAPGAWISVYKVCGGLGCFSSDAAAAVAQAVKDGVEVINFSVSGGTEPSTDPVELAFLDAYAAGVFVAASAGNSGPDAGTVNHLSPWVTTVAASTQLREFSSTLTLRAGDKTLTLRGSSITAGVGTSPVVRAADVPGYTGGAQCLRAAKKNAFAGKIIVCERGENARVEKGYFAFRAGAVGMILYNPTKQDTETDNHWLPTVHLADGSKLLPFLKRGNVQGSFTAGAARKGTGDVMAAFSSRGPGGLALKPDVTAPGVQILAGHTPVPDEPTGGPKGELFQAIAGTSMSGPHVAGAGILLAAAHPGWSPGQIKSALMTTAVTEVVKEDGITKADPLDLGAGRIAVDRAVTPGLTFDETAARMTALAANDVAAVQLNSPSINAPVMPGRLVVVRTARNVTDHALSYTAATTAPAKSSITVSPAAFTVAAGESVRLTITISSTAGKKQLFGAVRLTPASGSGVPALHLPVAFVPQQGSTTLTGDCSSTTMRLGGAVDCDYRVRNDSYAAATVKINAKIGEGTVVSGSTPPAGEVTLAGATPGLPSIAKVDGVHWHSLGALGIPAEPIGDEDILNFDTPSFTYAGASYDSIGVTSNGYLVVGGGGAQDLSAEPGGLPDPRRPNNVLAPFWTDLDGSGADGIRAGAVRVDGKDWIAVEWGVKVFGTDSDRRFQVWIALGDDPEVIFAYDPATPLAAPGALKWAIGAENMIGGGDARAALPTADLRVTATAGKPGQSIGYAFRVTGLRPGTTSIVTTMTSTSVPGTTVLKQPLTVVLR
ncbi:hypothetical protein F4553_004618 [Allocatelliglobosispora scoriae]|uniref:Serine protease n=1 Tax=Allocatelliglobosispora scoriae TaxID=643052 RepID=A0A841BVQ0_9ACTN|nr:S8 family serine peptidase [Allocatelliglobosispora scoriae]MBB5871239.1 hypothetical protein [Allocatelliglobosispora scoriae]